jgi:sulfotransferase
MKNFHFLSGLPRSGSTVLSAILNQNPKVFSTPTSPLLELLIANQHEWHANEPVKANPEPIQLTNITRAMIHATWQHRPEEIIIDKHFGWSPNIKDVSTLFEKPVKMIAPVRDLPSIMASWLSILRKNPNSFVHQNLQAAGMLINDEALVNDMWVRMVKDTIAGLVHGLNYDRSRFHLIEFNDIMNNPKVVLDGIEKFLDLPHYDYDFNNIRSDHNDFDLAAWGINGMHTVRPQLCSVSGNPREVLGDKLFKKFESIQKEMYTW